MKIAFIYNHKDWALHNVGKLWYGENEDVELRSCFDKELKLDDYDFVIFGWYGIYEMYNYNPNKSIILINDPCEIYEDDKDWKENGRLREGRIEILKKMRGILTVSVEMKQRLKMHGVEAHNTATASLLPFRESLTEQGVSCISVCQDYPRKQMSVLESIQKRCEGEGIRFYIKKGRKNVLTEEEYIKLLDDYTVYVCTSYMEGAPLPAFDALNRGCLVISTRVGQMQELRGFNGGLMLSEEKNIFDYIKVLNQMSVGALRTLRGVALERIQAERDVKMIREWAGANLRFACKGYVK